jgi:capsular exopolysaccharide synthesis family protein
MSHVDRALRLREGGHAASDPVAAHLRLDQYQREGHVTPIVTEPSHAIPSDGPVRPQRADVKAERPPQAPIGVDNVSKASGRLDHDLEARLVTRDTGPIPLEQYRRLAAVLHDVQVQQGLKSLMLTSALPHEGKTLTAVNLALTLSESYARQVLLIDADLRRPSLHRLFGVSNEAGLGDALRDGGANLAVRQVSPRLAVLPAGRPGPAPLAALTSARMGDLIQRCANEFDWVLLDTPPVGLMPDAQLLARLTRAAILVIAAGVTPASAVQRAVAELGSECIVGTVLNRVDGRHIPDTLYYQQHGVTQDT